MGYGFWVSGFGLQVLGFTFLASDKLDRALSAQNLRRNARIFPPSRGLHQRTSLPGEASWKERACEQCVQQAGPD